MSTASSRSTKKATKKKVTKKKAAAPGVPDPKRVRAILRGLKKTYPTVTCALTHESAFQLLAATILSAQCTDVRVNLVTPALFARFPDAASMAKADQATVEDLVRSTGFFRNKSKSLLGAARLITADYGGKVPPQMEELLRLPGVARKTANVVLGTFFGQAIGVVVDTHVKRISARWGFTTATRPEKIERDLMALLPKGEWIDYSHRVIWHGRELCKARKPLCGDCPLVPHCPAAAL